ncbi:MAG: hypothetical protein GTO18_12970 [Anaerolineales bacterium]|nr:hypothetical protein [Anaerolineales bacterium]
MTNWLRDVVLDTDEWVATVSPLSQSPIIAHSLSVLLVDELFNEVSEILPQDSLPPELSFINVAYDELIRDFAIDVVASVIQSDEFHEVWSTVNRALHEVFISVLRSERTFLYVEE